MHREFNNNNNIINKQYIYIYIEEPLTERAPLLEQQVVEGMKNVLYDVQ